MFVSKRFLNLFLTHLHQVCPFPHICYCPFFCFIVVCLFLSLPFCLSFCFFLSLFFLPDKLDEILAAAQQTISTNEAPGTRGQGPKRERGRSFYGNEVCIVNQATGLIYMCLKSVMTVSLIRLRRVPVLQ